MGAENGVLKNINGRLRADTSTRGTTGQPVVIGKYVPEGMPSHLPIFLYYDHYDALPESPAGPWNTPPFEPQLPKGKDGRSQFFA